MEEPPRYFAQRADSYHAASTAWPWRWLRQREASAVLDLLGDVREKRVLDLGSGAGFYTRLLLAAGAAHTHAVDMEAAMLAQLPREHITSTVGDAATVALPGPFPSIVCAGLLEFVADPAAVLKNARRAATTDTVLVSLVPAANLWGRCYRRFHRRHGIAVRLFTPPAIREMAAAANWSVASLRAVWPSAFCVRLHPAA